MINTGNFSSNLGPFDPDTVAEIIRNNREPQVEAPILSLCMTQGRMSRAGDETVNWYSADLPTRTTTIASAGYDNTTTSLAVASGAVFGVGDLIVSEATREVMYISAISTNTLTVVRGIGSANGGVAAATGSVANNTVLRRIGPAIGEAATTPADRDFGSVLHQNTLQTFRKAISVSGRAAVLDPQTEDPEAFEMAQSFEEFFRDIEHAIMFGGRVATGLNDASSRKVTTMQGLYNAITTNTFAVGGTMTKAYWEGTVVSQIAGRGSSRRYCIAGPTFMQAIGDLYSTNAARLESVDVAGVKLNRLQNMHGLEILLIPSRAMVGAFAGDALILDIDDQFRLRHTEGTLGGRVRSGLPNVVEVVQTGGADAVTKEWFAELTLQFGAQSKHGRVSGVTGASS